MQKNPTAHITAGGPTTFCAGGSVVLSEAPVAGSTYQWYKGASAIAGATGLNYTATTTGNYKCRVTKTASGCLKNSNAITVSVPCREDELSTENTFVIYPNPSTGEFTIDATIASDEKTATIEIYNSIGQLIKYETAEVSQNSVLKEINLTSFPAGIYTIRMEIHGVASASEILILQ